MKNKVLKTNNDSFNDNYSNNFYKSYSNVTIIYRFWIVFIL